MSSQPHKTICQSCRLEYDGDALFCPNCGTARSRDPGDADPLLGTTVGERYLLIERIGQGGSGTIYRAEHITLRRRVAVKVLHHELSRDDLAIERFRREATTVGEIDNDHIVEIHDFGRTSDGRLYLAMEFLEGHTLSQLIEHEGKLSVEQAIDILIQLGEALMEAHAMGYVHRDLRPRNIYLAVRRGRANYVKLLDFGLAKLVEKEGEAASTSLGMTFGDPHYMSPEQARGDPIDRRADIYSLGCIAYEMLIGEPPFVGEKAFDVLTRHVEGAPAEPAARRSDVPSWLNRALLRCLAKQPEERFVTVYRLVEALRQGTDSGVIMTDKVARKPETNPPPSVSRAMEKLASRQDEEEPPAESAEPEPSAGPAAGGETALGLGFRGADVRRSIDDGPTEPSPAPVPERAPEPPPREPAASPPPSAEAEEPDDEEELRATAPRRPEGRRQSRPTGKRRPGGPSSSAGISAAWYADGEAMEGEQELDEETRAKLDRARGRTPSRTGLMAAAEDDGFYDEPPTHRFKLVAGVIGGLVAVLMLVLWFWPSDGAESSAGAAPSDQKAEESAAPGEETGGEEETAAEATAASADAGEVAETAPPDAAPKKVASTGGGEAPDRDPESGGRDPGPDRDPDSGGRNPGPGSGGRDPGPGSGGRDPGSGSGGEDPEPDGDAPPDRDPKPSADKKKARFFANLGASELRNGNILGAATNFNKAIKHNPRSARARAGLGEVALTQGSYQAAIAHLRRARRLSPRSARVHTLLGEAYLGAGRRQRAADAFKKALKLDPDNARARNGFNEASGS